MPATTAIPTDRGHQWNMRFDAVRCRNCDAPMKFLEDVERPCPGAGKIRPIAGMRQQDVEFKPKLDQWPELKRRYDRWQAGERT